MICKNIKIKSIAAKEQHSFSYSNAQPSLFDNHLQIEADRTEAVVTTDHRTHGILHPTVVIFNGSVRGNFSFSEKVALTTCKRLYERTNGVPCRRTEAIWTLAVNRNPLLPYPHIARMLDGILVFRHQVLIFRLSHRCYSNLVHTIYFIGSICMMMCERLPKRSFSFRSMEVARSCTLFKLKLPSMRI